MSTVVPSCSTGCHPVFAGVGPTTSSRAGAEPNGVRGIDRLQDWEALLARGAVTQTHGFFTRGSVIGGEPISLGASAVINKTAVLFTAPVAWLLDRIKPTPKHSYGIPNSSGRGG